MMSNIPDRNSRPSFLAPGNWLGFLALMIMVIAARLPWRVQYVLGYYLIGPLAYTFASTRRKAAEVNIRLCFPQLSEEGRRNLVNAHFRALGIGIFEFGRAWWGRISPIAKVTRIEGLEYLQQYQAQGRGVLLISGHFTTLEICGRLLCEYATVSGMYRPHRHPVMEWAITQGRLRYAQHMFANAQMRAAIRYLKSGGFLWYAPDQDMRGKQSVFAPFFGVPASTITATHQLARMTGCAVVPFYHQRIGSHYVLKISPKLENFPTQDAVADTARINAAIAAMVTEAPDQYLWIHRRFKRQPNGAPSLYASQK